MQKLTNEQILLILTLSERCDSITGSSIANSDGSVFVDIHSVDDATVCQQEESFDRVFDIFREAIASPKEMFINPDGSTSQNYEFINSSGVNITFYTKKKPLLQTEAVEETVHPQCIVNVTKVQSLLEPWYVEQIFEERGVRK